MKYRYNFTYVQIFHTIFILYNVHISPVTSCPYFLFILVDNFTDAILYICKK